MRWDKTPRQSYQHWFIWLLKQIPSARSALSLSQCPCSLRCCRRLGRRCRFAIPPQYRPCDSPKACPDPGSPFSNGLPFWSSYGPWFRTPLIGSGSSLCRLTHSFAPLRDKASAGMSASFQAFPTGCNAQYNFQRGRQFILWFHSTADHGLQASELSLSSKVV